MSAIYPKAKEQMLQGGINMSTAVVKAVFIDNADEAYNPADVFITDVTAIGIVGTAVTLANKTFTNGVFDADDVTLTSVTGDPFEAVLIYIDTGTPATSRLIAYLDITTTTPNGGDILIAWDNGANKIFAL